MLNMYNVLTTQSGNTLAGKLKFLLIQLKLIWQILEQRVAKILALRCVVLHYRSSRQNCKIATEQIGPA